MPKKRIAVVKFQIANPKPNPKSLVSRLKTYMPDSTLSDTVMTPIPHRVGAGIVSEDYPKNITQSHLDLYHKNDVVHTLPMDYPMSFYADNTAKWLVRLADIRYGTEHNTVAHHGQVSINVVVDEEKTFEGFWTNEGVASEELGALYRRRFVQVGVVVVGNIIYLLMSETNKKLIDKVGWCVAEALGESLTMLSREHMNMIRFAKSVLMCEKFSDFGHGYFPRRGSFSEFDDGEFYIRKAAMKALPVGAYSHLFVNGAVDFGKTSSCSDAFPFFEHLEKSEKGENLTSLNIQTCNGLYGKPERKSINITASKGMVFSLSNVDPDDGEHIISDAPDLLGRVMADFLLDDLEGEADIAKRVAELSAVADESEDEPKKRSRRHSIVVEESDGRNIVVPADREKVIAIVNKNLKDPSLAVAADSLPEVSVGDITESRRRPKKQGIFHDDA